MHVRSSVWLLPVAAAFGCVPAGNSGSQDAGRPAGQAAARAPATGLPTPPSLLLRAPFEDDFEHGLIPSPYASLEPGAGANESPGSSNLPRFEPSRDWSPTVPGVWHIESGRLCGEHAHNHGIWLRRSLPVDARIEFDAVSESPDGDIKAEYWGDGRSAATALSYTNATSYLTILGGWHNRFHVLARINEHGGDRKEVVVGTNPDDPRERPVVPGQIYHFKVERTDGRTVRWWVDGNEMLAYVDPAPLVGLGHDHFGFNDWDAKVCFDNVRVVPLP